MKPTLFVAVLALIVASVAPTTASIPTTFTVDEGETVLLAGTITADSIVIAGTVQAVGDLSLTADRITLTDTARIYGADGVPDASVVADSATATDGGDGANLTFSARVLSIASGAHVQSGSGGAGGTAFGPSLALGGDGGDGGSIHLMAETATIDAVLLPGAGGDGGHDIATGTNHAGPAQGGAGGDSGMVYLNGGLFWQDLPDVLAPQTTSAETPLSDHLRGAVNINPPQCQPDQCIPSEFLDLCVSDPCPEPCEAAPLTDCLPSECPQDQSTTRTDCIPLLSPVVNTLRNFTRCDGYDRETCEEMCFGPEECIPSPLPILGNLWDFTEDPCNSFTEWDGCNDLLCDNDECELGPCLSFSCLGIYNCELGIGSQEKCGPIDPPTATAKAYIGAPHDGGGYICTGTMDPLATGTVSATVGGGAVIPASVTASVTVTSLNSYNFACDYAQIAEAFGSGGAMREVHVQSYEITWRDAAEPCPYDGVNAISCTTVARVLTDAFTGKGIAGPGGAGVDPVALPTEVEICPNPDVTTARALNRASIPSLDAPVTDFENWECQRFGIHYLS